MKDNLVLSGDYVCQPVYNASGQHMHFGYYCTKMLFVKFKKNPLTPMGVLAHRLCMLDRSLVPPSAWVTDHHSHMMYIYICNCVQLEEHYGLCSSQSHGAASNQQTCGSLCLCCLCSVACQHLNELVDDDGLRKQRVTMVSLWPIWSR